MNLEEEFNSRVVSYFVREYERGRTPNPCLACNEHVKFRALLDRAIAMDADYLATGHYARVIAEDGAFHLERALDEAKDQTYVLYTLGQRELSRLLFPIGHYVKDETRRLAFEMGLPLHDKPDSAEICFVPGNDYRAFIAERAASRPGAIALKDGSVVGSHEGVAGFTIGQRKGLGAFGSKRFVTDIDPELNIVTIGDEADLLSRRLWTEDVSWVYGAPPAAEFEALVKVRYKSPLAKASVRLSGAGAEVEFREPLRAITPGQAAVFYEGERVIGGGTIGRVGRVSSGERDTADILPASPHLA
jgi:tRNA-specific 2-thiouridylase